MDKAKAAVSDFLHKDGKHTTTVHETINPAVQNEHITKTRHENVTTAVDREVHQDHHHTSVQPVLAKEVLPEQHSHNVAAVETRELHHGDNSHIKERLEAERAQFKNTREIGATQETNAVAPTLSGEHVHHHVHETIQPVIQKETIQPSVVHTTIPVHEVHHNEAKHHTASALPAVSLSEFKSQGGSLTGREERRDKFDGEPRAVGSTLGGEGDPTIGGHGAKGTTHLTEKDGSSRGYNDSTTGSTTSGYNDSATGSSGYNDSTTGSSTRGTTGTTGTTGTKKASLLDKLNPTTDSNGDGKAGFMK